jgi:hypothetical protein
MTPGTWKIFTVSPAPCSSTALLVPLEHSHMWQSRRLLPGQTAQDIGDQYPHFALHGEGEVSSIRAYRFGSAALAIVGIRHQEWVAINLKIALPAPQDWRILLENAARVSRRSASTFQKAFLIRDELRPALFYGSNGCRMKLCLTAEQESAISTSLEFIEEKA